MHKSILNQKKKEGKFAGIVKRNGVKHNAKILDCGGRCVTIYDNNKKRQFSIPYNSIAVVK